MDRHRSGMDEEDEEHVEDERREAEVEADIDALVAMTEADYSRAKNFPPCCPLVYHHIAVDIKGGSLPALARFAYAHCYLLLFALLWNAAAVGAALFTLHDNGNEKLYIFGWILSLFYIIAALPIHFAIYYCLLYQGLRLMANSRLVGYFLFSLIQIAFYIFLGLGFPHTGGGGLVLMFDMWEAKRLVPGLLELISLVFWLFMIVAAVLIDLRLYRYYRLAKDNTQSLYGEVSEEASNRVIEAAWDNKETIASGAWNNRGKLSQAASFFTGRTSSSPSLDSASSSTAGGQEATGEPKQEEKKPTEPLPETIVLPVHFLE